MSETKTLNLVRQLAYTVELLCKALDKPENYPFGYFEELRRSASEVEAEARKELQH